MREPPNSSQRNPSSILTPNATLQRPGDNCIVRQVVDESHADSGPLQALVRVALATAAPPSIITQPHLQTTIHRPG
ncbi:MAG: hypothetical protein H0V18_07645 [Pyrinomonadaceae bacterium]|nr:hypothetical protein [Pyrinomonadaceae bacterium]